MKLIRIINNSKTKFITARGEFRIGRSMDFSEDEARALLRKKPDGSPVYEGISTQDSLLDGVTKNIQEAEAKTKADDKSKSRK
jgi:hypothetical protein